MVGGSTSARRTPRTLRTFRRDPPSKDSASGLSSIPNSPVLWAECPSLRALRFHSPQTIPPTVSTHSKVSDVSEISRVRTEGSVCAVEGGRIDFVQSTQGWSARLRRACAPNAGFVLKRERKRGFATPARRSRALQPASAACRIDALSILPFRHSGRAGAIRNLGAATQALAPGFIRLRSASYGG